MAHPLLKNQVKMASKWVFIGGMENAHPLQELIAQKPYRNRVKLIERLGNEYKN